MAFGYIRNTDIAQIEANQSKNIEKKFAVLKIVTTFAAKLS